MSAWWRNIGLVACGLVLGLGVIVTKNALSSTDKPKAPVVRENAGHDHAVSDHGPLVHRFSGPAGQAEATHDSSAVAPVPSERPESRKERIEIDMKEHEMLLVAHSQEPRDETWAPGTERQVQGALTKAQAQGTFRVGKVDCRTSTCVANVSWSNIRKARGEVRDLVPSIADDVPCIRRLMLPETGAGADGAVEAQMLLDCSEIRWGSAEPPRRAD